ncbi:hypothetical protein HID58_034158 [Brassica napus]|uniref:Uncharacterized protein n=1 Tax=Brassica napus TaxID=3708 RepID=A0ABQ8C290_BRANA|nr:hypothetical protein HID58_034158 [Brassica napus]
MITNVKQDLTLIESYPSAKQCIQNFIKMAKIFHRWRLLSPMSRPRVLRSLLSHRQLRWVHHEGQAEEKGEIDGAESKGRTLGDYDRWKLEDHQPPSLLQMELQNIDRFSESSRPQNSQRKVNLNTSKMQMGR